MKKILSYLLLLPVYFYRGKHFSDDSPSCRFVPTCSNTLLRLLKNTDLLRDYTWFVGYCVVIRGWVGLWSGSVKICCSYVAGYSYIIKRAFGRKYSQCRTWLFEPAEGCYYSIGIHPWKVLETEPEDWKRLEDAAGHPSVLAIGRQVWIELASADILLQKRGANPTNFIEWVSRKAVGDSLCEGV